MGKIDRANLISEGYEAAVRLNGLMAQYPLAFRRLWHRPGPRTSQKRAVQLLTDRSIKCGLLVGGNRSGKSEAGAMVAAAVAIGSADPGVSRWIRENELDPDSFNKEPGRICCVSLTSNESIRVQRPKINQFLPAGTYWKNQFGGGEAVAQLPNGGVVLFKTIDQGARSFQADAWDLCWFDEDPEDQACFNEARMRLVDKRGFCYVTMTPLRGLTWIWERFVRDSEPNTMCQWIHGEDNPYIPRDELETLLRSYGPHERAARARGEFTVLEGRVYPDWGRHKHVVEDVEIQSHWLRYASIDFGTRNPFCCLMAAVDPKDDTLYILDEHYQSEWTLSRHAEAMRAMFRQYGMPDQIVADPEDRGSRLSLASEHDMPTIKARKEIRAGINAVAERLAGDVNGEPHIFVHSRCKNLIREIESYIWDQRRGKANTNQRDLPAKANDHAMDALRYLCMHLKRADFAAG